MLIKAILFGVCSQFGKMKLLDYRVPSGFLTQNSNFLALKGLCLIYSRRLLRPKNGYKHIFEERLWINKERFTVFFADLRGINGFFECFVGGVRNLVQRMRRYNHSYANNKVQPNNK